MCVVQLCLNYTFQLLRPMFASEVPKNNIQVTRSVWTPLALSVCGRSFHVQAVTEPF